MLYLLSYQVIRFAGAKVLLFFFMTTFQLQFFSFVQQTFTLTDDNNFIISTIHNSTRLIVARSAIDDDVHQVLVAVVNLLWVGEVGVDLVFLVGQRSGHDGTPELLDDVRDDGLVRDADANGLLFALEDARDVVVGLQNEGERPGHVTLHHLKDIVVDGLGELAQHTEVVEDKRKVGLLLLDAFDLAYALEGARVVDATAQAVQSVGGEDDGAAVGQALQDHLDITRIRIRRVEFEYHGLAKNRAKIVKMFNC